MKANRIFDLVIDGKSLSEQHGEYLVVNEDPDALRLADLVSIQSDIQGASIACSMFIEETGKLDSDTKRLRVFFESAIISYGRAFASGKGNGDRRPRHKIDDLLRMLEPEQLQTHENTVRIRNQHVGHRVDPGVQSAMVLASFDRTSMKFKGISPFLADQIDSSIITALARCVETIAELLETEIFRECSVLTEEYENQIEKGAFQLPAALTNLST